MEKILDREEKKKETIFWKNSWFVVLAANAILLIISVYNFYSFFFSSLLSEIHIAFKITSILSNLSFLMVVCNLVLLLVSLFFSATYWKKWLIMILIGLILKGVEYTLYSLFDFDNLINSLK